MQIHTLEQALDNVEQRYENLLIHLRALQTEWAGRSVPDYSNPTTADDARVWAFNDCAADLADILKDA